MFVLKIKFQYHFSSLWTERQILESLRFKLLKSTRHRSPVAWTAGSFIKTMGVFMQKVWAKGYRGMPAVGLKGHDTD